MTASSERINKELKEVGVSAYGRWKRPSRLLHEIIRNDEHIEGVAYGQSVQGSAMLVATDKRVIFIEANLAYNSTDDFGYQSINGVAHQSSMMSESIILYTRLNTYHLTHVNRSSAARFVTVIEDRSANAGKVGKDLDLSYEAVDDELVNDEVASDEVADDNAKEISYARLTDVERGFLNAHTTMVISTSLRTGRVYSSVVYYTLINDAFYILTKKDTQKARAMMAVKNVAIIIYDQAAKQTAQIQAEAVVVDNPQMSQRAFAEISSVMHGGIDKSPVAQLDAGGYVVFSLRPTEVQYYDFGSKK